MHRVQCCEHHGVLSCLAVPSRHAAPRALPPFRPERHPHFAFDLPAIGLCSPRSHASRTKRTMLLTQQPTYCIAAQFITCPTPSPRCRRLPRPLRMTFLISTHEARERSFVCRGPAVDPAAPPHWNLPDRSRRHFWSNSSKIIINWGGYLTPI